MMMMMKLTCMYRLQLNEMISVNILYYRHCVCLINFFTLPTVVVNTYLNIRPPIPCGPADMLSMSSLLSVTVTVFSSNIIENCTLKWHTKCNILAFEVYS